MTTADLRRRLGVVSPEDKARPWPHEPEPQPSPPACTNCADRGYVSAPRGGGYMDCPYCREA